MSGSGSVEEIKDLAQQIQETIRQERARLTQEKKNAEQTIKNINAQIEQLQKVCSHPNAYEKGLDGLEGWYCDDCGYGELYIGKMSQRKRGRPRKKKME